MPHVLRTAYPHLATAVILAAWGVLVLDVLPFGPDPSDAMGRLALLVAGTGSIGRLFQRLMAPAHELFAAGKMCGRTEAFAERDTEVPNLDERRALRAVSKP